MKLPCRIERPKLTPAPHLWYNLPAGISGTLRSPRLQHRFFVRGEQSAMNLDVFQDSPTFSPERKFVAPSHRESLALSWLSHACNADPKYPVGTIHSIYFDTPDLSAYNEKQNGTFLKRKVRLRWYGAPEHPGATRIPAYLEVKSKAGEGRRKSRLRLELDRALLERAPLSDAAFPALLRDGAPELREKIPAGLTPVVVVSYRRRRFVCPATGARVSLDSSIDAARSNESLLPVRGRVTIDKVVVEVKDSGSRDIFWLKTLYAAGFRKESFSKYGECLSQLIVEE